MVNKVIVFESNQGVCICNPAPEMFDSNSSTRTQLRHNGIDFNSDDEIMQWIKNKDVPSDTTSLIIETTDLPDDTMFTYSWEILYNSIIINMDRARHVWMDSLRRMRHQKFIDLGFPYRLNKELEDAVIDADTRQLLTELRDMPQTYDLSGCHTIDELKTMIPDILK